MAGHIRTLRGAVVGHTEWVHFARVDHVPRPGEIVHARENWEEVGGGAVIAAARIAEFGATSLFFTALGDDPVSERAREALAGLGVTVHAGHRPAPQPRAFTYVDADAERTITVLGGVLSPRGAEPLPWAALSSADFVYFAYGDVKALQQARSAKWLVATARDLPTLAAAGVKLDVLLHSGKDPGERYAPGDIDPRPSIVVTTGGAEGGFYEVEGGASGRYAAVPPPGPLADTYGAGDSFAAGLAFALGRGDTLIDALAFAAAAGSAALTRRGSGLVGGCG